MALLLSILQACVDISSRWLLVLIALGGALLEDIPETWSLLPSIEKMFFEAWHVTYV